MREDLLIQNYPFLYGNQAVFLTTFWLTRCTDLLPARSVFKPKPLSFPQIFELSPKKPTVSLQMISNTVKVKEFLRFYEKNLNIALSAGSVSPMEEGGRSLPLLLPDGQSVSSIEQTQEFFNRQT